MPELPDIVAYIHALESRIVAQPIQQIRLASPFLLRTAEPPITEVEGHAVRELRRIGKRIAIGVEGDLWLVVHLMIAGRLHWRQRGAKLAGRQSLAAFDFPNGSLCSPKPAQSIARRYTCCVGRKGAIRRPWWNRHFRQRSQFIS